MDQDNPNRIAIDRLILTLIGALAGAAAYALIEIVPDLIDNERLILLLVAAAGGFFALFLAATGPLSFGRAALAALVAALPAAVLLYWASFRFATVEDFLETGAPIVAYLVILIVTLPFLIALQRPSEGWRNYPALFTQSWNIVVRYAAAWVFVGVFWAVILLSNELFRLVGLNVIERLLDMDPVPFVLTGAVLGLAMAVVVELSDYISPFLILRLLRLLVPVVLVVTVVFLAALPLRGLSDLFGGLSAAATLLAMAGGIATLITSALDRTDAEAVDARVMSVSAQVLALALPVLSGLAIYAVVLRVTDYGWSPARIAAVTLSMVMLGYGFCYALAVILRRNWKARIRGANIAMALVAIVIAVLWLTPVINPQRITANTQVARLKNGAVALDGFDFWFVTRELGVAGQVAQARLTEMEHPEQDALQTRLTRVKASDSRNDFNAVQRAEARPELIATLREKLAVLPENTALPMAALEGLSLGKLRDIIKGCDYQTPAGHAGCAVVFADFLPDEPGQEGIAIYARNEKSVRTQVLWSKPGQPGFAQPVFLHGQNAFDLSLETIDALRDGSYTLGPTKVMTLSVGDVQMMLRP